LVECVGLVGGLRNFLRMSGWKTREMTTFMLSEANILR
jgi:hypothetical protein